MAFTYSAALTSGIDQVRFLIGDNVSGGGGVAPYELEDEEITWLLGQTSDVYAAAALAAETIQASKSDKVSKTVGDLKIEAQQEFEHWGAVVKRMKTRTASLVAPRAGGISITEKDRQREDSDRVRPAFVRRQFGNPGTSGDSELSDYSGKD